MKQQVLEQVSTKTLRAMVSELQLAGIDKRKRNAMILALVEMEEVTLSAFERYLQPKDLQAIVQHFEISADTQWSSVLTQLSSPLVVSESTPDWEARLANIQYMAEVSQKKSSHTGPRFVAFDFETADPWRDSACSIGLARVENGVVVEEAHHLIRPPRSNVQLSHVHGITWDMVKGEPSFSELWPTLQEWFQDIDFLVAHNLSFDRSVMRACCEAAGVPLPDIEFRCTMKESRNLWDIRPTKLTNVCKELDIKLDRSDPLAHTKACAQVMISLLEESSTTTTSKKTASTKKTAAKKKTTVKKTASKKKATTKSTKKPTKEVQPTTEQPTTEQPTTTKELTTTKKPTTKKKLTAKRVRKRREGLEAQEVVVEDVEQVNVEQAPEIATPEKEEDVWVKPVATHPDVVFQHLVSPARLARFFYHDCERYLRYQTVPEGHRAALGIPETKSAFNPVVRKLMERGYAWESKSVGWLQERSKVHIAAGEGELHERTHSAKASLALLAQLAPGESIYQPTIRVPDSFLTRYNLDPSLIDFPACRPDVLMAREGEDGSVILRVVDMKASNALKTSHRIQAALYVLILQEIIKNEGLPLIIDTRQAAIWLYDQPLPTLFPLDMSCRLLDSFLQHRLHEILQTPLDQAPWHLHYRCEWCDFFVHCRQEAKATRDVSLVPYLTAGGRQYLREASWDETGTVQSLQDLNQLLERQDASEILEQCGSLRGREVRLQSAVKALQSQEVVPYNSASTSFPKHEHIRIVFTLQSDPLSGQIYAAGFRRMMGQSVYDNGSCTELFVADTPEQCVEVRRDFVNKLYSELETLHNYNETQEWKQQKTLQCYVFDSYERTLFHELLLEALRDTEVAEVALSLLFYFQTEALVEAEKHPDTDIPHPVVAIIEAIHDLVALPYPLVIRLEEAIKSLPSSSYRYHYENNDLLCFELSNALKSDAIFMAWEGEKKDATEWIEQELQKRLIAASVVIDGLREQVRDHLMIWPPKFKLPEAMSFEHEELSRLAFITRYESFLGAIQTRASRAKPYDTRVQEGISIPLRYLGGDRWEVLSSIDSIALDTDNGMLKRLLVPKGMPGEQAQMAYDDYRHRKSWGPPKGLVRLASLTEIKADSTGDLAREIQLDVKKHRDQKPFEPGDEAILHPRYIDFTSHRVLKRLNSIDAKDDCDFITFIRDPQAYANAPILQDESIEWALDEASESGLTTSQFHAFHHMLHHRLTLLWGPPGTGKTHFLAQAVRCLLATRQPNQPPLRIAVTAFTHAALENLMREIKDILDHHQLGDSYEMFKIGEPRTQRGDGLKWFTEKDAAATELNASGWIVGGTVFKWMKACEHGLEPFEIMMVDEGSQMKPGEFSLGLKALSPQGRLIIAGDDLQLPPIIQGVYPKSRDQLPGLQDSIFAYLRARENKEAPYTCQLHENWRMNTTLSQFSAETLYGTSYRPARPKIARRALKLSTSKAKPAPKKKPKKRAHPSSSRSEKKAPTQPNNAKLSNWLLDPSYPLVLCILENAQGVQENSVEAELVAQLAVSLRQQLHNQEYNGLYPSTLEGDRKFWQQSLCIVSPHHQHIRSIRRALSRQHTWYSSPFVDTVDKMQGQQSEAVFVSYGVDDLETAISEAEFIYSLNRLNVSVTRAQAKCIVCLSRPLLQSTFELLENEKATRGLSHMHALASFCQRHGQREEFSYISAQTNGKNRITALRCRVSSSLAFQS